MSPRPPPKIHDCMKELGSEVARQPDGEVTRQAKGSQLTQPNANPNHDRTGRPVVCPEGGAHRSQEIDTHLSRDSKNSFQAKNLIKDEGNVELFELFETEPNT